MKFNFLNLLLFLTLTANATHTVGRKIYVTDIVNKSGVSVFKFPTTLPTASRVCSINADGEVTSSGISLTTLNFLDATSSIQTQLDSKESVLTFTAPLSRSVNTITCQTASGSQVGCLSSSDWTTFNSKYSGLPSQTGNSGKFLTTNGTTESWATVTAGITALTGDVTASGTGSVAATVAAVGGQTATNVAAGAVLANAATDANTASTIAKRDSNGNVYANSWDQRTTSISTSGGTATFTATQPYQNWFTGVSNHTAKLPDATTLNQGRMFLLRNFSTGTITVQDNGSNVLGTIAPGTERILTARLVSSSNGTWGFSAENVIGPASATDTGIALFSGTTGKILSGTSNYTIVDATPVFQTNVAAASTGPRMHQFTHGTTTGTGSGDGVIMGYPTANSGLFSIKMQDQLNGGTFQFAGTQGVFLEYDDWNGQVTLSNNTGGATHVRVNNTPRIQFNANNGISHGNISTSGWYIGSETTSASARLHIVGGTTTAGRAPIKLTSGTLMTTAEDGAIEYDGKFWLSPSTASERFAVLQPTGASKPTCSATYRGQHWVTPGGAGVADILEFCLKDAADVYAWVTK